jgi:ABC-type oligopeptide transport system ATPase subunit
MGNQPRKSVLVPKIPEPEQEQGSEADEGKGIEQTIVFDEVPTLPTPAIVITGGEGSGKTTLCRQILRLVGNDGKLLITRNELDRMIGGRTCSDVSKSTLWETIRACRLANEEQKTLSSDAQAGYEWLEANLETIFDKNGEPTDAFKKNSEILGLHLAILREDSGFLAALNRFSGVVRPGLLAELQAVKLKLPSNYEKLAKSKLKENPSELLKTITIFKSPQFGWKFHSDILKEDMALLEGSSIHPLQNSNIDPSLRCFRYFRDQLPRAWIYLKKMTDRELHFWEIRDLQSMVNNTKSPIFIVFTFREEFFSKFNRDTFRRNFAQFNHTSAEAALLYMQEYYLGLLRVKDAANRITFLTINSLDLEDVRLIISFVESKLKPPVVGEDNAS